MSLLKRIYWILILCMGVGLLSTSCTQEIVFREPALQGVKDTTNLWLSFDVKCIPITVDVNNTYFVVEATNGVESINFRLTGKTPAKYEIGTSNSKTATYTTAVGASIIEYTTGTGRGSGYFSIKEMDTINNTITGEFQFEALKTSTDTLFSPKVKFTKGVFYKVPIL